MKCFNTKRSFLPAMLAIAFGLAIAGMPIQAEAATPAFTITALANSTGMVIIDQNNGKITFCTSSTELYTTPSISIAPTGNCEYMATITPTAGTTDSLSAVSVGATLWVVNNVSGGFIECAVTSNIPANDIHSVPISSCINWGTAY